MVVKHNANMLLEMSVLHLLLKERRKVFGEISAELGFVCRSRNFSLASVCLVAGLTSCRCRTRCMVVFVSSIRRRLKEDG